MHGGFPSLVALILVLLAPLVWLKERKALAVCLCALSLLWFMQPHVMDVETLQDLTPVALWGVAAVRLYRDGNTEAVRVGTMLVSLPLLELVFRLWAWLR
jgi:hypothetical protein